METSGHFDSCLSCGEKDKSNFRFWCIDVKNFIYVLCKSCRLGNGPAVPDVYYGYGSGTHTEENIAYPRGHEKAGQPIPFSSKREKMEAMKLAGVREAGDRVHGAPKHYEKF